MEFSHSSISKCKECPANSDLVKSRSGERTALPESARDSFSKVAYVLQERSNLGPDFSRYFIAALHHHLESDLEG